MTDIFRLTYADPRLNEDPTAIVFLRILETDLNLHCPFDGDNEWQMTIEGTVTLTRRERRKKRREEDGRR